MKKALAGPAKQTEKRTAKKKPERRAMIAATQRRIRAASRRAGKRLRGFGPGLAAATRKLDRAADRQLRRAWPAIARTGRLARAVATRLRPVAVLLFRLMARLERGLLRSAALAGRAATRASAVLTPQRAICLTIVGSAVCLIVTQFVDYRAVEIGQSGYAGLPAASAPTVGGERAGEAHAFLLVPVAVLAAGLALAAMRNERRRGLGRIIFALGLLSLGVILLVDLPAGLDVGAEASRFSGAEAVLYGGFYAQIAAAAGLMLGGALLVAAPKATARYHARPCRTRTNLFARVASGLKRRRRRRASSRAKGARRASRRRSGEASAPASPR
jgi:hypothetical protein